MSQGELTGLGMGFLKWLQAGPVRVKRARRHPKPGLSSYYWDGGAPVARDVKDISATGAFLCTSNSEEWYPGTIVSVLLQRASAQEGPAETSDSVNISCKVARRAADGVGVRFVFDNARERKSLEQFLSRALKDANGSAISGKDTEGQALVEFALMVPLLFLLIVNMVNFGGFFYAWITVANAARVGAQYAVLAGASAGSPAQPTAASIDTVINNDVFSLLNGSSPNVNICIYNGSTIEATPYQQGSCSGTSPDPEPASYVGAVVDVTYTYNPFIPLFSFPGLGIRATLPPTTIHRRTYMRVIQ